jgi:hypothetical protein
MAEPAVKHLVTANRLRDGIPVYRTGDGWSPAIADARLVPESESKALLAAAEDEPKPQTVVTPYLIEAVEEGGTVRPVTLRERIRATGPTI